MAGVGQKYGITGSQDAGWTFTGTTVGPATGALNGTLGATTPAAATVTTLTVSSTFTLGGTAVTASAAELNYLDIATLGTGAASKAVVLDAGDDYTWPAAGILTYGGTGITASGAEINYLDIATLGTGAASKAVVLDAGEDYTWPATGVLTYGGTGITATGAELNYLDITTLGTGAASKAVVLDAGEDYTWPATGILTYGGGAITATGTEINEVIQCLDIADGSADATYYVVCPHAGAIGRIWTVIDAVVSTADITITANIGATPVTDGVVTIATAGSAAGDVDSATPSAANVVTAGQAVNFVVAGGGAGGAPRIHLAFTIIR